MIILYSITTPGLLGFKMKEGWSGIKGETMEFLITSDGRYLEEDRFD